LLLCIDGYRKLQSFHSVTAKVSEYDPANTRNFIFLHNPICTYKSKRSRLPSISPFRHNHHTHTHTHIYECFESGMPAPLLPNFESKIRTWSACTGCLFYRCTENGSLHLPEISLNICVVQNGDRRNALYKKRYKKLTLHITVRIGNNYKAFL